MHTRGLLIATLQTTMVSAALPPTWKIGAKWQFEIQEPVIVPADNAALKPDADVWDIDLWHADQNHSIAEALHVGSQ